MMLLGTKYAEIPTPPINKNQITFENLDSIAHTLYGECLESKTAELFNYENTKPLPQIAKKIRHFCRNLKTVFKPTITTITRRKLLLKHTLQMIFDLLL